MRDLYQSVKRASAICCIVNQVENQNLQNHAKVNEKGKWTAPSRHWSSNRRGLYQWRAFSGYTNKHWPPRSLAGRVNIALDKVSASIHNATYCGLPVAPLHAASSIHSDMQLPTGRRNLFTTLRVSCEKPIGKTRQRAV